VAASLTGLRDTDQRVRDLREHPVDWGSGPAAWVNPATLRLSPTTESGTLVTAHDG